MIIPEDIVYFDNFEVGLVKDGVLLRAKAPLFARWIQDTQVQRDASGKLRSHHEGEPWARANDTSFYLPIEDWAFGDRAGFAPASTVSAAFFNNDKPNCTWLFHKELGTGCEILVKQAISLNNWEDYFSSCCSLITDIWTSELRKVTACARFIDRADAAI